MIYAGKGGGVVKVGVAARIAGCLDYPPLSGTVAGVMDERKGGSFIILSRRLSSLVEKFLTRQQSILDIWLQRSHNASRGKTMNTTQTHDSVVRARIDTVTKDRAAGALADMGLSVSDAIRLLLIRVADERRLPFEVKAPNVTTRRAIEELEAGKGLKFDSVAEMMAVLDAED